MRGQILLNEAEALVKELRAAEVRHKGEFTPTGGCVVSDMAKDAANMIERLVEAVKYM